MLKVAKFGGSSLADVKQFEKVRSIVEADPARKVIVVSAPGKRFSKDNKITDLLYLCYAHIKYGVDYRPMLESIRERYREIVDGLGINFDLDAAFAEIESALGSDASESYLVSRGEYLCARICAKYLGYEFVDAKDTVFLNYDGSIDTDRTYEAIKLAYSKSSGRIVVPGFFGSLDDGEICLMSRGGSDITGAIFAAALDADIYENWTDVPGILMADPSIVKDPYPIPKITYDELRELTYMGAKVLHEASVYPVKVAGIPVNIRDTNNPEADGTLIDESFENDDLKDDKFYITGITGKKHYTIIDVKKDNLSLDAISTVMQVLVSRGIKVEQVNSGLDVFSVILENGVNKQSVYSIATEIEKLTGGSVKISEGISMIACVSRRMVFRSGISGLIFGALGENDINIRLISQGARELNILIGVADEDCDRTVQVLYDSFTKRGNN
ncbi:MAG: aspartate kinase [Firmicutes bacterium]|nr:aspartate kinase [Bacillota bacterium]